MRVQHHSRDTSYWARVLDSEEELEKHIQMGLMLVSHFFLFGAHELSYVKCLVCS